MKNQMSDKIHSVKDLMGKTIELPHRAPILYRWSNNCCIASNDR